LRSASAPEELVADLKLRCDASVKWDGPTSAAEAREVAICSWPSEEGGVEYGKRRKEVHERGRKGKEREADEAHGYTAGTEAALLAERSRKGPNGGVPW
jgi:hypothetical protein